MVSSFSLQLVVCKLHLQAVRCPAILSRNCFWFKAALEKPSFGSSFVGSIAKLLPVYEPKENTLIAGNFDFRAKDVVAEFFKKQKPDEDAVSDKEMKRLISQTVLLFLT